MSIKFLAEDDRPREKFLLKGRNALSDSELLAIIMGSGSQDESAIELARRILASAGNNWHELSLKSVQDLMKFKGIGEAKAISIATALEIGRRRALQEVAERKIIGGSQDAYLFFKPYLSDLHTEEFWAIFLNSSNKVIHQAQFHQGGISGTLVDVRVLFRVALEHYATAVIVAHNHPSGSLVPSTEDKLLTQKILEAGNLLEIKLLDHLIITQNSYFSFSDAGLL